MRHGTRIGAAIAVVVALGLGASVAAPAATRQAATTPKQGGSATFAMINEISSLDPAKIINAASQGGPIGNGLYDVLIWVDTQTGKVNPGLALSLTSQDGANWTMKLRPNVKFTDGTSLDAAAVKFSWDRLKEPALGSPSRAA